MNTLAPESVQASEPNEFSARAVAPSGMMRPSGSPPDGQAAPVATTATGEPLSSDFFSASDIARALGIHKKRVLRAARRDAWPTKTTGYRLLLQPPPEIAAIIVASPSPGGEGRGEGGRITVKFADLAHSDQQREKTLRRETAVKMLRENLHLGKTIALETTAAIMRAQFPGFKCQPNALRQWDARYTAAGLDGLVEQKRGVVGIKPFAADLDNEDILRARAAAIEHGSARKGDGKPQLNIARAYRNALVGNPSITGPARAWLHGDYSSKSYVPPSVRQALTAAPLTASLIQRGPRAAKLDGAWTECDYSNVRAGDAFTADDMTANVYVWSPWPGDQGFIVMRPQILAAMDIGSMCWLGLRAVMRPKGQYNHDDVWGLIGDIFDDFGLFKIAVLEGGTWQSKEITGHLCDDETRFGGLRALGCKVIHTRTPRGKIIETAFNTLQHAADNCRGFCGRRERIDRPEILKQQLYAVEKGHAHPRQYFMDLMEYRHHLETVMRNLNDERGDGKILRGQSPAEKWSDDAPQNRQLPDNAKWMYRASYAVNTVTRNGVRISTGSGKYAMHYYYSAPALVEQRGRRVATFWNDYDPDTDAVVYSIRNGRPHELICVAPRVQPLSRFGASQEEMHAESTRKAALANVARVERATLAPYLQRTPPASPSPGGEGRGEGGRSLPDIATQLHRAKTDRAETLRARRSVRDFTGTADALLDSEISNPESEMVGVAQTGRATDVPAGMPLEGRSRVQIPPPTDPETTTLSADALLD